MPSGSENIMSLKKLITPYKDKKDSGLLSVKVEGNEHLVKIYFELGMVAGLSIGTLKNEACLDILSKCKPLESSFIKGYRKPDYVGAAAEIDSKLAELFASYPVTGATMSADKDSKVVTPDNLRKIEADFIDIIGPIGKMIIDTVYSEMGYARGNPMLSPLYSHLIDRLMGDLPAEQRSTFAAKYAIGLALDGH